MKKILIALILVAVVVLTANAYQGNYMICWAKDRGICGSCMFATAKQARDTANQVNRETGRNDKFTIKRCEN